jgi:hypothetical protein
VLLSSSPSLHSPPPSFGFQKRLARGGGTPLQQHPAAGYFPHGRPHSCSSRSSGSRRRPAGGLGGVAGRADPCSRWDRHFLDGMCSCAPGHMHKASSPRLTTTTSSSSTTSIPRSSSGGSQPAGLACSHLDESAQCALPVQHASHEASHLNAHCAPTTSICLALHHKYVHGRYMYDGQLWR